MLVFLDTETTGVDPYRDRIVELAMLDQAGSPLLVTRVNPEVPIPAEATQIHGIGDSDVADAPRFTEIAPQVQDLVSGPVVLVGYSCRRFDTVLLHNELLRAEQPGLSCDKYGRITIPEIDLFELWLRQENRKLVTAAQRFAGIVMGDDAHGAEADAAVLPAVLRGMCLAFSLDIEDSDQLCKLSIPEGAIDRDGKFLKREDGVIVFNFGKTKGQPAMADVGLLDWVTRQAFMTPETKRIAEALIERAYRKLSA